MVGGLLHHPHICPILTHFPTKSGGGVRQPTQKGPPIRRRNIGDIHPKSAGGNPEVKEQSASYTTATTLKHGVIPDAKRRENVSKVNAGGKLYRRRAENISPRAQIRN